MGTLLAAGFGGALLFRLVGLLFVVVGLLNVVRPREMTSYAIRRRTGGSIDGRIEPTPTRLLLARIFGGFFVLVGAGLTLGLLGP